MPQCSIFIVTTKNGQTQVLEDSIDQHFARYHSCESSWSFANDWL